MAQTLTLYYSLTPTLDDLTGQANFDPFTQGSSSPVVPASRVWGWNGSFYAVDQKNQGNGSGQLPALPVISAGSLANNPLTVNVVCMQNFTSGWAYQSGGNSAQIAVVFGRIKKDSGNGSQPNASPFNVDSRCTSIFYPGELGLPRSGDGLEITLGTYSSPGALNIGKFAFRVNLLAYLTYTGSGTPVNYSISYGHDPDMEVGS